MQPTQCLFRRLGFNFINMDTFTLPFIYFLKLENVDYMDRKLEEY